MTLDELLARWDERDRRYRLPQGLSLTDELADGVRAHRGWEIATHLKVAADRRVAFKALGRWQPPHPVTF